MIIFDIETLPDPVFGGPDPERVKVPANYRDPEKIAEFKREHADKEWRGRAACPVTGKIAAISACLLDPGMQSPQVISWFEADERELLWRFQEWLLSLEPAPDSQVYAPQRPVVAWRGCSFDFAFVSYRAARYEFRYLARRMSSPKYGSRSHIDPSLMACFRDARFRDVCCSLNVDHPSVGGGALVLDQVMAGRLDLVVSHCEDDARALWHVAARLARAGVLG
jgi:hypothetical protein